MKFFFSVAILNVRDGPFRGVRGVGDFQFAEFFLAQCLCRNFFFG